MDKPIRLLLTVSGGLENLAEEQILTLFGDVLQNRTWYRRTSGSQLYLDLHRSNLGGICVANVIADAIKKVDYVEYVYVLLDSIDVPESESASDVLSLIYEATSNISRVSIDFCENLCNCVHQSQRNDVDVGLGTLPGVLLPTPDVHVTDDSMGCANARCNSFAVNTIYTRKDVAKAVVDQVLTFIQQHYQNGVDKNALWLDAGSGDGSLLEHLPARTSIGVDTHPTSSAVYCMDFLKISTNWLQQKCSYNDLFVISNPPFSVNSRGDFSPIVSFINHSFNVLEAKFVAVICPSKFGRERIWKSLGLTETAYLWARFLLPQNAFYDPTTGKSVHIHSFCLMFGCQKMSSHNDGDNKQVSLSKSGSYISAKRDKGSYREISTSELTTSIVSGLSNTGMKLAPERHARHVLHAKLHSSFELWWQLNPDKPCSSVNTNSAKIPNHSLGWISLSVKPAVALAMTSLTMKENTTNGCVAVNLMGGEGTIELESSRAVNYPIFMISGDIRFDCAVKTSKRIASFKDNGNCNLLVDLVVWDAQNLPLRKGFADAVLGDLPIQGTLKKSHQQPAVGGSIGSTASLKYSSVLSESSRILRSKGRAAFTSVDYKSLGGVCKKFNWISLNHGASINLGGLTGKLFLTERNEPCTKDLCLTVPESTDHSSWLLDLASKAFEETNIDCLERKTVKPVASVHLLNSFSHPEDRYLRQCYRISFHDEIRNVGAKQLEKEIRKVVNANLLDGMSL
jgi:hypothetical protein